MLGQGPDEIAKFLAKTTGLNKTMVGEYLGEREDMCLKVMHAYVDAMNFAGSQFDEAIRWGAKSGLTTDFALLPCCACISVQAHHLTMMVRVAAADPASSHGLLMSRLRQRYGKIWLQSCLQVVSHVGGQDVLEWLPIAGGGTED